MRIQYETVYEVYKVDRAGEVTILDWWYDRQTALLDASKRNASVRARIREIYLPLSDRTK